MNRVTITLHIDLPDGVVPNVEYGPQEPPDLVPLASSVFADETRYDADVVVRPVAQPAPACPTHSTAMERFPAGTNKAGKHYNASWRCPVKACETKPIWDKSAA